RTDLRLVNLTSGARRVVLSGRGLATNGVPNDARAVVTLPSRSIRALDDVLGTLLGAADGTVGGLRFEADGTVLVLGRTTNVRTDGSTFGSIQALAAPGEELVSGETGTFVGLRQSPA